MQSQLFGAASLAASVEVPMPPPLAPHAWPFPGLTPAESAMAAVANSRAYADLLAAVIQAQGGAELTGAEVLALVPSNWLEVCGRFAHASLCPRHGDERGIQIKYVTHDGGGFHFTYRAVSPWGV